MEVFLFLLDFYSKGLVEYMRGCLSLFFFMETLETFAPEGSSSYRHSSCNISRFQFIFYGVDYVIRIELNSHLLRRLLALPGTFIDLTPSRVFRNDSLHMQSSHLSKTIIAQQRTGWWRSKAARSNRLIVIP